MEKGLQTMFATVLGAVLLLVGIIGFVNNPVLGLFPVNTLHNLVHLVSGAVLLWAGAWGGAAKARMVNKTFGIVYLLVAILGFLVPSVAALFAIETMDNVLHTVIAVVTLWVGYGGKD